MKAHQIVCDGCGQPLDLKLGSLDFKPLRGGLELIVTGPLPEKGNAETSTHLINEHIQLHPGTECFGKYVSKAVAKIAQDRAEQEAKNKAAKAEKK